MTQNIWIVIPAYNEATVIASVISDIQKSGYRNILVVDDGSSDDTVSCATKAGAEVLSHIMNRGQGAALKTGIDYLSTTYQPDIIVTFDGDGQHHTSDIAILTQPIIDNVADIVLGSRFIHPEKAIPFLRKIILKAGIIFTNFISHVHLTDTHNGLRAMNKKAYRSITIVHRGMEHASNIIDEIIPNHLRYQEVPVRVIYTDYSLEKGQRNSGFIKLGIRILFNKYFL